MKYTGNKTIMNKNVSADHFTAQQPANPAPFVSRLTVYWHPVQGSNICISLSNTYKLYSHDVPHIIIMLFYSLSFLPHFDFIVAAMRPLWLAYTMHEWCNSKTRLHTCRKLLCQMYILKKQHIICCYLCHIQISSWDWETSVQNRRECIGYTTSRDSFAPGPSFTISN